MKRADFNPENLIIQIDLNFMGILERAFKLNSHRSIKMILNQILIVQDAHKYRQLLMYDLPIIMENKYIRIDEFFNISRTIEQKTTSQEYGGCNMEVQLENQMMELPMFSDHEFESYKVKDFASILRIEDDICHEIRD